MNIMPGSLLAKIARVATIVPVLVVPACRDERPLELGQPVVGAPISVASVLEGRPRLLDSQITVSGEVSQVCEMARCWLLLRDHGGELHVDLLGFTVPDGVRGARCVAGGKLVEADGRLTLLARGLRIDR